METNFRIKAKSKDQPTLWLSLGPTSSRGEKILAVLEGQDLPQKAVKYLWKQIESMFQQGELIAEEPVLLTEIKKYCGNANEAIAIVGDEYFCRHCYEDSFGYRIIDSTELLPKQEERYCDACVLE